MDPNSPTSDPDVPQEDVDFAYHLLQQGESEETILQKLADKGISTDLGKEVLHDLNLDLARDQALGLLQKGHTIPYVKSKLIAKGLEPEEADAVLENLQAQDAAAQRQGSTRLLLMLLAILVFSTGITLQIGNFFPMLPFAGYLVMGIGVFIGIGSRQA